MKTTRMTEDVAKKVLESYRANDFNAKKALPLVGYSLSTAEARGGKIINTASRTLARAELERIASGDKKAVSAFAHLTEDEIRGEYVFIIKQNKDLPSKLKALLPLLKEYGVRFDEEEKKSVAPVNITFKQNVMAQPGQDTNVAQHILCDTIETAQQSHEAIAPRVGGDIGNTKEGVSPILKNSEIDTIDKPVEVSPNISEEIPDSFIN